MEKDAPPPPPQQSPPPPAPISVNWAVQPPRGAVNREAPIGNVGVPAEKGGELEAALEVLGLIALKGKVIVSLDHAVVRQLLGLT